jgi:FkbM family methyltransferase
MSARSGDFISYSANREDVLLDRLFREQKSGFYIDVGAAHPMFENDTKALYDRGWSGINIEPNKSFYDALAAERKRDRNLNLAVSDDSGELRFFEVVGTGLSTCDPEEAGRAREKGFEIIERPIKTETLQNILSAENPPRIDLLKIDVEGFEPNVIRSNDWNRFRPHVILAEATFPETPTRRPDVAGALLEKEGYRRVYFDGLNDYYLEKNFVAPEGAFDTPPNVFDRFIPLAQVQLAGERDFLRDEGQHLKRERADALREIASLRTELNRRRFLEEDLQRSRDELASVYARMTVLGEQMEEIVATRTAAQAQLAAMEARRAGLEAQMEVLEAQMAVLETQWAAAEAHLAAIRRSTSWRITQPFRALARPRRTLRILAGKRAD